MLKDFGYKINVVERKNRSGGGVSLLYRSNIEVSCDEKGEYESNHLSMHCGECG